jgi:hypothetical protein
VDHVLQRGNATAQTGIKLWPQQRRWLTAIWMADGPAADSANNVYLVTANGVFDTLDAGSFPTWATWATRS